MQPHPSAKFLRLGDALALGGSLLVFVFSFTPFVTVSIPALLGGVEDSQNAWATETFMAPLTWFVVLAGLLQIAAVAVRYLGGRDPELLGFRLTQLEVGLGLFMLVVLFSMVTSEKHVIFGAAARVQGEGGAKLETGWGAILILVGALAAAVGAVLTHLSVGPTIFPRPVAAAPSPGYGQPTTEGEPYPQSYPAPPTAPPAGPQPYAQTPAGPQPPEAQPYAPAPGAQPGPAPQQPPATPPQQPS
jgi:hypothetical protein